MVLKDFLGGSLNLKNALECYKFRKNFYLKNPTYFDPDGLTCFVGPQGSGKTLSAVKYVVSLMEYYPKAMLVTNIDIKAYPVDNQRVFRFANADDLSKYQNGQDGVIFLIDEIQLYFNSLESKNIDPQVMVQISQQRKQRKHIVCTSQVFGRMAKPLREQFSSIIVCKKMFNSLQHNCLLDRDSLDDDANSSGTDIKGKIIASYWWFHNPKDYQMYDTYNIINNNFKNVKEGIDIYGSTITTNNQLVH